MNEFIKQHQKKLSMGLGILLLVVSVAMLFWDNKNGVSEEEAKTAANVARMEARAQARMSGQPLSKEEKKPYFMQKYKEKQEKQLRYALILMIITGVGFVGYGYFRKEEA